MDIQTAAKQAEEEGKCITRTGNPLMANIKIKPTNGGMRCIVYKTFGSGHCKAWLPYGNDLTADDWEVVD